MFESNPYAMVGVAMIGELHRTVSEKVEAAEKREPRPYRTWNHRLAEIVVNLWRGGEVARPYPDECDIGCI